MPVFKALDVVGKACFRKNLLEGWIEKLQCFKETVKDLRDDEDIQRSCTLKFHLVFSQIKFWCETEGQILGTVSAQTGEAMHGTFERCLDRKNNDLFLAVGTHNSEAFWPQTDDSADQNEK